MKASVIKKNNNNKTKTKQKHTCIKAHVIRQVGERNY